MCSPVRPTLVWWSKCGRQRDRICVAALQPLTRDAAIRVCNACRRHDREALAQRPFQRVLSKFALTLLFPAFRASALVALCRGLLQDQLLPLPHRSQGVGLPRFCHNSLCRRGKPFRAGCANRYDMLPWGQSTIVGVTLCNRSHSCTIYHHSEGLSGSKFGASLDGQMSHRARRPRSSSRLAS
jgi:hypothetical protein